MHRTGGFLMQIKKTMEYKVEKFLIAKGNPTAIVEGCSENQRVEIARSLLNTGRPPIEQVGFLYRSGTIPRFTMMGNERFKVSAKVDKIG